MSMHTAMTISSTLHLHKDLSIRERESLLCFVLSCDRIYLLSHPHKTLSETDIQTYKSLCQKRQSHTPLAYLTGSRAFYRHTFTVTPNVLIPRPESELLVEHTQNILDQTNQPTTVIDIGTGSGCLIISIIDQLAEKEATKHAFFGIDFSEEALAVAKQNKEKILPKSKHLTLIQSDLLNTFLDTKKICNDIHTTKQTILVANLPYVPEEKKEEAKEIPDMNELQHEPDIALWSPEKGLWHYKRLLQQLSSYKQLYEQEKVYCLMEMNPDQIGPLMAHAKKEYTNAKYSIVKDLANKERILIMEIS